MKWNSFLLVKLLLLMGSTLIKAQTNSDFLSFKNFNPASPEMKLFQRYGDIPVNLSSGIPSINIPLFEIKSGQLSLPISISYHASGIKVEDMASPVGLGWVLNAGGSISRTVVGKRDELPDVGFLTMENFLTRAMLDSDPLFDGDDKLTKLINTAEGNWDTQSDEYYINIPGFSCRFLYDTNKVIHSDAVNRQLIIERDLANNSFQIIDEDGSKYFFKEKEYTQCIEVGYVDPTAWMLEKIISNDNTDSILFRYTNANQYSDSYYSYTMIINNQFLPYDPQDAENCKSELLTNIYSNNSTYLYDRLLLDSIIFRNGYLKFNYASDREDPIDDRMVGINLKSQEGLVKSVTFNQSYFESETPAAGRNNKRLKLDKMEFRGEDSTVVNSYSFDYNPLELPAYRNYSGTGSGPKNLEFDYWGYYNNNGANGLQTLIPTGLDTPIIQYIYSCGFSSTQPQLDLYEMWSSNREADDYYSAACMLQKIIYPTGGYTTFEYEGNKAYESENEKLVGGMRIKKILDYAYNGIISGQRQYQYGNGNNCGINISPVLPYTYYYWRPTIYQKKMCLPSVPCLNYINCVGNDFIISSNSTTPINFFNGSPVFYDIVTEFEGTTNTNIGKTVYKYEYESDKIFGYDAVRYGTFKTNRNWIRGQLLEKKVYDHRDSLKYFLKNYYSTLGLKTIKAGFISEKTTELDCSECILGPLPVETFLSQQNPINDKHLLNYFDYLDIDYDLGVKMLTKSEEIDYLKDTISRITRYYYDSPYHLYLSKKESRQSDSAYLIEYYLYPQNNDSISGLSSNGFNALDTLIAKNILTPVIEKKTYRDSLLIEKDLSEYKIPYSGSVKVGYLKRQIGTGQLTTEAEFNYDVTGNIIEQFKTNDLKTSIVWGYSKTLPVAVVTNAASGEIAYTGFEDSDDFGNWGHSGGTRSNSFSKTGLYSFYNTSLSSGVNSKSVVSVWARNCTPSISGYNPVKTYNSQDGWTFYEWIINPGSFTIIGNSGYLDDARLHPVGALMKTYSYKPLIGVISMTDENNLTTYYEYDSFGRLKCIRDNNKKIIRNIDYNYKPQN